MPPNEDASDRALATRALDLYWNSDRGVNSIADDLGVSKGRLYEMIAPVSAGARCGICDAEMVFGTRTDREKNRASCPSCGSDEDVGARRGDVGPRRGDVGARRGGAGGNREATTPDATGDVAAPPDSTRVLGSVLIGAAALLLLLRYVRR